MTKIPTEEIIEVFNNDKAIWQKNDKWHYYCRKRIEKFISKNQKIINKSKWIINAGSSGESYDIPDEKTLHVDLVYERIKNKPNYLTANIENIPTESASSDLILCVGSVVNYADIFIAIKEFSRLIKPDGNLILEFECSNTLELVGTKEFNANATIKETFYRGEHSKVWYYSETWVIEILKEFEFEIVMIDRWHFISPLILRITKNGNFSNQFSLIDNLISKIPFLNRYCSNVILTAKKK